MNKGFTLLELLIVIAILAVLATVVVLILDPAETIRKARDVQRISDLSTLKTAIILFIGEKGGGTAIAGPGAANECRSAGTACGGGGPCACVSTILSVATGYNPIVEGHRPQELKYGWLPIDFTLMGGGAPISSLPIDPVNTVDYYYRYNTDGVDFIFDCVLESKYYTVSVELQKTDGGQCDTSYEVGTDLTMFKNYCRL